MSVFEPCKKCGIVEEHAWGDDIICGRCSNTPQSYDPKNSLAKYMKQNSLSSDDVQGISVSHKHFSEGEIVSISIDGVKVKTDDYGQFIIAREFLEVKESELA